VPASRIVTARMAFDIDTDFMKLLLFYSRNAGLGWRRPSVAG
jgi:hypothetical protein